WIGKNSHMDAGGIDGVDIVINVEKEGDIGLHAVSVQLEERQFLGGVVARHSGIDGFDRYAAGLRNVVFQTAGEDVIDLATPPESDRVAEHQEPVHAGDTGFQRPVAQADFIGRDLYSFECASIAGGILEVEKVIQHEDSHVAPNLAIEIGA